jgi:acyl carrier protein
VNRDDVIEAVYDACTEVLGADRSTLSETTAFAADLDADSLALVEIVMLLEERFDLRIPESELEGVSTVAAAADLVVRHLEAAA